MNTLVRTILVPLLLLAAPAAAAGDEATVQAPASGGGRIVDLGAMVVSGVQPGPGLWKVTRGEHVLYILGTVTPLPRRMEWASGEVESVIARSGVVITPPASAIRPDVGVFRGMAMLPAALRARNNPDGRRLRDVVSPESYARWEVLKARYLGRDRGVEKRRPLFAAGELYGAALEASGLRQGGVVWPVVRKAARTAGVPVVDATVRVDVADPKGTLRELRGTELADRECFEGTMARIETDLGNMRARANAWAGGDIAALRALPAHDHRAACIDALTTGDLARKLGLDDVEARARAQWLDHVDQALEAHAVSFAVLPIQQLLADDGLLAALAARGYGVTDP